MRISKGIADAGDRSAVPLLLVAGSSAWCYTELRKFRSERGDCMLQAIRRLSKTYLAMIVVCLLAVGGAVYFFLAQRASRHAAELFNYYMAKQQVAHL